MDMHCRRRYSQQFRRRRWWWWWWRYINPGCERCCPGQAKQTGRRTKQLS